MINKIKIYISIGLVAIFLMILGYGIHLYKQNKKLEKEILNIENELEVKTNMSNVYINSLGQYSTQIKSYNKSLKELKHSKDSIEKVIYKQLKASNVKLKKAKEALFIATTTTGTANIDTVYKVEVKTDTFIEYMTIAHYSDEWLEAIVYPDSLWYSIDDSLVAAKYPIMIDRNFFLWKWINWKKESDNLFIEITSLNPSSKVKGYLIKIEGAR